MVITEELAIEHLRTSAARVRAVIRTGLLDSPTEETFDRLSHLATKLLRVPIAFLSLIDAGRDFYKSCVGFDESFLEIRQLTGPTFCHYTLRSAAPLVINDTHADAVYRQVPTVESVGVRAYLGIPLVTDDGHHIGSFCVVDKVAREWLPLEIDTMVELAGSALREINLRGLVSEARKAAAFAQGAIVEKERLVATIAHDLRTPLASLVLSFELVTRAKPSAAASAAAKAAFQTASDTMTGMLTNLLALPHGDSDHMLVAPEGLVSDAISMMAPLVAQKNIRLVNRTPTGLSPVAIDYRRTLRVFSNLIGNAMKFSPPETEIVLDAVDDDAHIRFSVADAGCGIAAADQARIFESGWQADKTDSRGIGLGLSIVREIVEAQGGTVSVTSEPDVGSTFSFRLPKAVDHGARQLY